MKQMILLFFFLFLPLYPQTLIQTIDLPNNNHFNYGYGMVAKDGNLWIGTTYTASSIGYKLYAVDTNGVLKDSLILNKPHINECYGICWDGSYFWWVKRYTTNTRIFKVNTSGQVLDSINYPPTGWYPGGACYDNGGIWVSVYYPNDKCGVYKMRLPDGITIDTVKVQGLQPQGVTVKGDTLFYVMDGFEGDPERIYAVRISTKDTLFSFKVPEVPGQRQNPRGLAWDGKYLYLLAEPVGASSGRKVFKYSLAGAGNPTINLLTKTIAFQNWYIDSTKSASISVQNVGDAKLRIDSIVISNTSFTLVPSVFPVEINPGATFDFTAKFKPNRYGVFNDSVIFYHNDNGNPPRYTKFSGYGVYTAPFVYTADFNYSYGQKKNKSTSLKDFIIENRGSQKLKIFSISSNSPFYRDPMTRPTGFPDTITIDSVSTYKLRIWYKPALTGITNDSIVMMTNSVPSQRYVIKLNAESVNKVDSLGTIRWQTMIPANPSTSYQDYSAAAIRQIPDVTGDGKPDIVLDAENYQLLLYNGNSSGTADLVWRFNHGYNNNNTGKVERVGALQVINDVDGDGLNDVVVGLGGGNEFVYCISGRTGTKIWEFGDSVNYQNGDINGIDCRRDFNNDGKPDVLATASGDQNGNGRYTIYCFNGVNGNLIFQISQASPSLYTSGITSTTFGGVFSSYSTSGSAPYYVRGFNKQGQIVWSANTVAAVWSVIEVGDLGGSPHSDVVAGDFSGYMYAFDGENGQLFWQKYVSGPFFTDLRMIPDVNGNGYPEVFGAGPDPSLILIDSKTGNQIWNYPIGSILLGVSEVPDCNNDGYAECLAGVLGNNLVLVNGQTGSLMFQYMMGSGGNGTAAEKMSALNDVDDDGFPEFVASARDGKLICFSGGTTAQASDSIRVISPNGGEKWTINTNRDIIWTASAGVTNVKIEYTVDGGLVWIPIVASTPASTGTYTWLTPATPSDNCRIKISSVNNPGIMDVSDNLFSLTISNCKDVEVNADWNIVSVPVFSANMSKAALFPTAISSAYGYNEGYSVFDTLKNAKGFWLKFPQSQVISVCGNNINENTVSVSAGWNLIGPYHNNVPVAGITSTPPGIMATSFYGYNNGYFTPSSLISGKGYWVKTNSAGVLNLNVKEFGKNEIYSMPEITSSERIIITDKKGRETTLFFSENGENITAYELPPPPPAGAFDVRFSTGRFVENINDGKKDITMSGITYPVKIKAEGISLNINDLIDGHSLNKNLGNGEELIISDNKIKLFSVSKAEIPTEYLLYQNYPNPFNPVTKIKFALPVKSNVLILLYNSLGQNVGILLNEEKDAGYHSLQFDGSKLSSGIYFYKITAGGFTTVKKMMLIK